MKPFIFGLAFILIFLGSAWRMRETCFETGNVTWFDEEHQFCSYETMCLSPDGSVSIDYVVHECRVFAKKQSILTKVRHV